MDKVYKQCWQALASWILWLNFPLIMLLLLGSFEALPPINPVLKAIVILGTIITVIKILWRRILKFQLFDDGIMVWGRGYDGLKLGWRELLEPLLQTKNRWIMPSEQSFSFKRAGSELETTIWLTELSPKDQLDVAKIIREKVPQLKEYTQG